MTTSPKNLNSTNQPSESRARWFFIILLLAFAAVVIYALYKQPLKLPSFNRQTETIQPGFFKVVEVADGDTITVNMNGSREIIRMVGIDTPETHHPDKPVQCFGEAASDFTHSLLDGKTVRLESDPESTNRDRYDRLLRYVYTEQGELVNKKLVAEGYGFAYTSFPFTKLGEFRQAEQEAREQNRGLWAGCGIEESGGYINTKPAN